mmetsp:Transcript_13147/g.16605  ORF Transcript_13147/g.16605 Transcript_13147/m.16605 type:complete len:136 (+) Transcript_13147:74-481(+)|eukprot:CAMPEP_0172497452 /NCGR_PEP_ID=MMETSP1066-20121228/100131_1 /TAXON_ID=671091 /ORGANISM="Coscinodiscus wailesii, Strain CCMP2513" /LENGTH=135 /DNA_ID=CAMNT_0013270245 /DNA_START=74 /DNA_END=481 /DNA_ORIENTATION=-
MPESNKAKIRRLQKANRAAGIGDEMGRLPARIKDAAVMMKCVVCFAEFKVTKTNTELKAHAESKHGKANYEECFPGAESKRQELIEKTSGKGGGGSSGGKKVGETKAARKKKAAAEMDDLLSAGLSTGKKGKGKK